MWQRFVEPARKAIFYAQEEAGRLNTSEVEPEHILLGLLREDNEATLILTKMGIDLDALRAIVEKQLGPSQKINQTDMMLTPRSKHVIDLSYEEARTLGDDYIGTEHLLLGILHEREGFPDRAQGDFGLTLDKTREGIALYRRPLAERENASKTRSGTWHRFTERARNVVFFAREEATQLGTRQVAPEHLLLGLIRENDSVAARILDRLNVKPSALRAAILERIVFGDDVLGQDLVLTSESQRVIDLSYDEARRLNNNYIGTEHLLLGLIREETSLATHILIELGVTLAQMREEVSLMQNGYPSKTEVSQENRENPPRRGAPSLQGSVNTWQRFSERFRKVVFFAQEEAIQLGTTQVAPEHLLLGLIRENDNLAAMVLGRLSMSCDDVRETILERITPTRDDGQGPDLMLTSEAKRVTDLCFEEARRLNNNYIGTEHLLLALICEDTSLAAKVLIEMGATLERTREQVMLMQNGQ